jgi:hypothetical protein
MLQSTNLCTGHFFQWNEGSLFWFLYLSCLRNKSRHKNNDPLTAATRNWKPDNKNVEENLCKHMNTLIDFQDDKDLACLEIIIASQQQASTNPDHTSTNEVSSQIK